MLLKHGPYVHAAIIELTEIISNGLVGSCESVPVGQPTRSLLREQHWHSGLVSSDLSPARLSVRAICVRKVERVLRI
jgi:hypothetical protein